MPIKMNTHIAAYHTMIHNDTHVYCIHLYTHVSSEWWVVLLLKLFPYTTSLYIAMTTTNRTIVLPRFFKNSSMDSAFMERSTRILRDLLPLSSSCFLEFRKCWWIEWIHELYSTTQMALWTSMNSSFFWGWIEWHILTPSTPGSCALWFASSSFVFPCSPQMRCNFQTAQLGTSFAALVPRREPGPGYWSLFRVFFFSLWGPPHSQIFQSAALSLSAPASASSAEPACQLRSEPFAWCVCVWLYQITALVPAFLEAKSPTLWTF